MLACQPREMYVYTVAQRHGHVVELHGTQRRTTVSLAGPYDGLSLKDSAQNFLSDVKVKVSKM